MPVGNLTPVPLSVQLRQALERELDDQAPGAPQRRRVLLASVTVIAERGWTGATVSDIVRAAGVSRSTFYEHFDGKQGCALAVYSALGRLILDESRRSVLAHAPAGWQAAVRAGVDTLFLLLKAEPPLTRFFFVESEAIGPEYLRARAAVHHAQAAIVRETFDQLALSDPGTPTISGTELELTVGGVDTLIGHALAGGHPELLDQVADATFALLERTGTPPERRELV
jgi:AcrR family transcriptional regulator